MQDYYLTVDKFLDHAAKWFSTVDTVEAGEGRLSYAVMRERSNRLSGALLALGAMPSDRKAASHAPSRSGALSRECPPSAV